MLTAERRFSPLLASLERRFQNFQTSAPRSQSRLGVHDHWFPAKKPPRIAIGPSEHRLSAWQTEYIHDEITSLHLEWIYKGTKGVCLNQLIDQGDIRARRPAVFVRAPSNLSALSDLSTLISSTTIVRTLNQERVNSVTVLTIVKQQKSI